MARKITRVVRLAALAMAAASCASGADGTTGVAAADANTDPASTPAAADPTGNGDLAYAVPAGEMLATFTASEVIAILSVASADAIAQAGFAQLRTDNPDVRAFAEHIIADHTRVLGRLTPLRPAYLGPDPTSLLLQREDQLVELDLRTQGGAQVFELAYMTAQVTAHAKIIALLDRSLLPSIADARAIRSVVLDLRSLYVRRLVEALDLQRRILRSAMTAGPTDTTGYGGGSPPSNPPRINAPPK
ncbi:MAG: hypothetical protein JWO86_4054 [Myxococcaceae bacterium]|jgi:putative membrane protein|nr:hypothetical protein [Myxococcaceae bacterium]MEA2746237.1 hypothetical protein [Myxococcales bacterium]